MPFDSFFPNPLDPTDWRNYLAGPLGAGPGFIEQIGRAFNKPNTYSYNGPRPQGSLIDRMKAEAARQKADRDERKAIAEGRSSQSTSMADILSRLESLQDPSRYMSGQDALSAQARSAADAQFNPLIAALRNQKGAAEQRGNRYKNEIGQMFSALSTDLNSQIPQISQTYENTKQSTAQEYTDLQNMIKDQYASSQAEQEDLFKRLNIEAAMGSTAPQQMRDRDFFTNLAATEGQTQQAALGTEQRGATEFTRQGANIAQMEGPQRQASLMADLQEILSAYDGRIAENEAARESAYASGLLELQGNDRKNAADLAQRDFENYIKSIQLGRDLRKDELTGLSSGPVKSPADVATRAMRMNLSSGQAQRIQDTFMSGLGDEFVLGAYNANTGTPASKEALAARILELGRQRGMNRAELNALHTIALEYFGRG